MRLSTPSFPKNVGMNFNNPYVKQKRHLPNFHLNECPQKSDQSHSTSDEIKLQSPAKDKLENSYGVLQSPEKIEKKYINGKIRTVGTDPNFLDSYFAASRLSFIGTFKQRTSSTNHCNKSISSSHAKRLIFHVDMDCFFASVVLRNFPQFQNKPVVISHHGKRSTNEHHDNNRGKTNYISFDHSRDQQPRHIPKTSSSECATCNYEARKYGIKKGMFLGRAKELCPELIVLDYDFKGYEEVSEQVLEILDRLASSENHHGIVETVSCDEAYIELNFEASGLENVYDHAFQLAESVRNEIFDTTQCTASIGVGVNKFLAKLGTDKAKPNKSYCVRDHRELLKCLKLRDMHGVGWKTENKLIEEGLVTVQDVWDLGPRGEIELIRILGQGTGKKIFMFTQGEDDRPISPVERKTVGAECNYGVRFDGPYGIDYFMQGLAKEVEKRMLGISMKGKRLTLKIKQRKKGASKHHKFLGHGSCHNLSKSANIPGGMVTRDSKVFKKVGMSLLREFGIEDINEIRGMGITISSLENDNANENESNVHGMKSWLQKNIDPNTFESNDSNEKVETPNQSINEKNRGTKCVLQSTPESKRILGIETEDDERENKAIANGHSPLMIDLPPMSQIKMTQVEALPPEFQEQIIYRMKKADAGGIEEGNVRGSVDAGMIEEKRTNEEVETSHEFSDEEALVTGDFMRYTPQSRRKSGTEAEIEEIEDRSIRNFDSPLMIELPPMSQIKMSQVEALPPDLQQQVISRMKGNTTDVGTIDETHYVNHFVPKQQIVGDGQQYSAGRFRQTDLKRMMKLAAVKSGHENTSISLTQLEQLPLEIKLQVVNRDDREVGILSQHASRSTNINDRRRRKSVYSATNAIDGLCSKPKRGSANQSRNKKKHKNMGNSRKKKRDVPNMSARKVRIVDRVNSWKEDVLPLKQFLGDHCPVRYPDSIDKVVDFLSIVLKEGRLTAMVTMIRCIRNRQDKWSTIEIIERIAQTMNRLHIERYGSDLDVEWLMGTAEE
uniref:DNA repair protein REV1 n=1 Tax=Pseudo-nitzschia australis TaxID=44445 RepID=A0A7S4EEM1_9STRA